MLQLFTFVIFLLLLLYSKFHGKLLTAALLLEMKDGKDEMELLRDQIIKKEIETDALKSNAKKVGDREGHNEDFMILWNDRVAAALDDLTEIKTKLIN
jgi:hypothetical protein